MIDRLTPEILRALGLYRTLANMAELGIGETISREYGITNDDLYLIAIIITEERVFQQELEEQRIQHGGG